MGRYFRMLFGGAAALSLALLVACGGGGDGGATTDTPEPVFTWQSARFLETSPGHVLEADVAIGADGSGVAVWVQLVGTQGKRHAFASRYRNGLWEPPVQVSNEVEGNPHRLQVAMLPDGEALAIWSQDVTNEDQSVYSKRSVNGAWSGPQTVVQEGLHKVGLITLEADANGRAVAVWDQVRDEGGIAVVQSAVFHQGELTETRTLSAGTSAKGVDIAIDAKGDALVAWVELDPVINTDTVRVRALVAGVWQPEKHLKPSEETLGAPRNSRHPQVALSTGGTAYVATANLANTRVEIRRAIDFAAGNWLDDVILLGTSPSAHMGPELAVDQQGNATLVWLEDEGDIANVVSARLAKGTDGIAVHELGRVEAGPHYADTPVVAIDGRGRVMVVWMQENPTGSYDVWSSQFDPVRGTWSAPELVERDDVGSAYTGLSLAVNDAGRALAVWAQGIFGETSNHFDAMGNALR